MDHALRLAYFTCSLLHALLLTFTYLRQGVHMMFNGEFVEPWGDMPRVNRLVFIGKHLDREELTASFESCFFNLTSSTVRL